LRRVKREIRRAKRGHKIVLAEKAKENPKRFYKYIKGKRVTRERVGPLQDQQGHLCVGPQEMGETLNEYFSSVFTVQKSMDVKELGEINSDVLRSVFITEKEVLEVLKRIKIDKSPGPDEVYPRTLWEAREEIASPLAEIFKSSIVTGEVPEDWTVANVVPLFKEGCREKPGNYRPVSLTSVVGKLLEGTLRDRIYRHLERQGLIRDSQHSFVSGKSCLTNLVEFFEGVTKKVDEGSAVDVVYMDFSKTFDKVPHGRLLHKVKSHGIQGEVDKWILNWLDDGRQRVVVEGFLQTGGL